MVSFLQVYQTSLIENSNYLDSFILVALEIKHSLLKTHL